MLKSISNFVTDTYKIGETTYYTWTFYKGLHIIKVTKSHKNNCSKLSWIVEQNGVKQDVPNILQFIYDHYIEIKTAYESKATNKRFQTVMSSFIGSPTFCSSDSYGWTLYYSNHIMIVIKAYSFKQLREKTIEFQNINTKDNDKSFFKRVNGEHLLQFVMKNSGKLSTKPKNASTARATEDVDTIVQNDIPDLCENRQHTITSDKKVSDKVKKTLFIKFPLKKRLYYQAGKDYLEDLNIKRLDCVSQSESELEESDEDKLFMSD